MNTPSLREFLNEEQFAAATAPDGPILVLAAAGTGKTRTLVFRVAHLVLHGTPPERVLLLTFTNRAAREMLSRAEHLVGPGSGGVWGGTFHHLGNRILRRYAARLGYPLDFAILDRDDAASLVSACVEACGLRRKGLPKRDVLLSLFSAAANTEQDLRTVLERRHLEQEVDPADIVTVGQAYLEKKRALGAMDFDDLLVQCLRVLKEQPDVRARYQEQFRHVLVDEYQDTNTIQSQLVDLLAAGSRNLFVVGDDFQSIYSWRGADYRNILSFPQRYPDTRIFKLETNYRSVPEILSVANACIAGNPEQFQKTLRATRPAHRRPRVVRLRDGDAQARYVCDLIRQLTRHGTPASGIAVLYRAHYHAMELQMELTRERVRHVITSGLRFFEQAHIKDVCSLLRVLENPRDEVAFLRLAGLFRGVGPKTAERIWVRLGRSFDLNDEAHRAALRAALRGEAQAQWREIEPAMVDYAGSARTGADAARAVGDFTERFYEHYAGTAFDDFERRLEDVGELLAHMAREESARSFLDDVALLTNLDAEMDAEADAPEAVRLSTVHQAKGLEWPVVIVLWATDGMFPSGRSLAESEGGEAEERRLFYVAVTRAQDELHLCVPERRLTRDGGVYPCTPSQFVREIPPECVEQVWE